MPVNKSHWYDGCFYDTFIAPIQDKLFGQINGLIESESITGNNKSSFYKSYCCIGEIKYLYFHALVS